MTDAHAIDAWAGRTEFSCHPVAFKRNALVTDTGLYDEANDDYQGFWARQAAELMTWSQDWHTICEWELPYRNGSSAAN